MLRGGFADGATVTSASGAEARIAGLQRLLGGLSAKIARAEEGDTAAFQRLEGFATGERFGEGRSAPAPAELSPAPRPTQSLAIHVKERKDETRLSAALAKLTEEDGALTFEHDPESARTQARRSGRDAPARDGRAARRAVRRRGRGVAAPGRLSRDDPRARRGARPAEEAIGRPRPVRRRLVEVAPRGRGEGFAFAEKIHGGTVPRQYFPSVEIGAREALQRGPLGFPVVDVAVTLLDGSYHAVDSSDMAFRAAAKIALQEALPKARPVLLEPVLAVDIHVPEEAISRVSALVAEPARPDPRL